MRSRQSVQTSRVSAENIMSFWPEFSALVLIAMSSVFKFGGNTPEFLIF